MQVDFYGIFRLITGRKTSEFNLTQNSTLLDLLQAVTGRFPALRDEILDERGALLPYIPLFINGRNPRLLPGGVDTPVRSQDVVSIFSPISSGRINVENINQTLSRSF